MRFVFPASPRSIERALARASTAPATYDATIAGRPGYEHDLLVAVVGHGEGDFIAARDGLTIWAAHVVPGVSVFPLSAPVALGATRLVTFGTPILAIAAPCRITDVIDETRRAGFTYVTLLGHPEEGEETFTVEHDALGDVRFTVEARSRPGSAVVRATRPINRIVQGRVARGYIRSLERHVASRPTRDR